MRQSANPLRLRAVRRLRVHPSRLLEAPAIVEVREHAGGDASVALRGVVCGVCAARTQGALAGVPGVESASVDLDAAEATLRLAPGVRPDVEALQRALERVAIAMPTRRLIERVAGVIAGPRLFRTSPPHPVTGR